MSEKITSKKIIDKCRGVEGKTKRVVIVSPAWPYRGGIASFSQRLAEEFISRGDSVSIINFTLQYPSILFPGKSQYTDAPEPTHLKITREVNSINPLSWFRVGRKIKRLCPDILIFRYWLPFMSPSLGTIGRVAKRNGKTKVVALVDNLTPHEKRLGDRTLTKYFTKMCHSFITMSSPVRREVEALEPTKRCSMEFHPPYDLYGDAVPIERAREELNLDSEYRYMLFFGFIRDYKGLDTLLKAFSDRRFREMKVRLIVAGEFYSDSAPYLEMIERYGLSDDVILHTSFIPDDKVPLYFSVADIVVQPYKHATQSGVTQICYHYNSPMLVTDVGGLAEIVPDGKVGYVTEPNEGSVTEALLDFFNNSRKEEFVKGIIDEKSKFSWRHLTDIFHEHSEE